MSSSGRHRLLKAGIWDAIAGTRRFRQEQAAALEVARELLAFVGISHRGDTLARNMPYGDQRRLEIARALATDPRLLLLDEPAAGMNPQEGMRLVGLIQRIREERGVTVVMIEHHMRVVMAVLDRITVLDRGHVLAEGRPAEIHADERVIAAYLGTPCRRRSTAFGFQGGAGRMSQTLDVQNICVSYGMVEAVRNVSFRVPEGSIAAIVGANGAGKSTILNAPSGLRNPPAGACASVSAISATFPPHERVPMGLAQVPEGGACSAG